MTKKKPAAQKAPPKKKPVAATPVRVAGEPMFWLFKSEPDVFSWDMLVAKGAKGEAWDGVRNFLARNNMRAMQVGDLGFFYHSNEGKEVVGVVVVAAPAHPDPKDDSGTWECVDVVAVTPFAKPVTLAAVKTTPSLSQMSLVTSMRLSVQPVRADEFTQICEMGGIDPTRLNQEAARALGHAPKPAKAKSKGKA
jgi:predicted RNA-binding protein with PUA-like domain